MYHVRTARGNCARASLEKVARLHAAAMGTVNVGERTPPGRSVVPLSTSFKTVASLAVRGLLGVLSCTARGLLDPIVILIVIGFGYKHIEKDTITKPSVGGIESIPSCHIPLL